MEGRVIEVTALLADKNMKVLCEGCYGGRCERLGNHRWECTSCGTIMSTAEESKREAALHE
jgi:ribosomal protein L37AE/L43A